MVSLGSFGLRQVKAPAEAKPDKKPESEEKPKEPEKDPSQHGAIPLGSKCVKNAYIGA